MTWGRVSCNSKMASFLVNCMSGLPSELNGSKCQLKKINVCRMSIVYVVRTIEREMNSALL